MDGNLLEDLLGRLVVVPEIRRGGLFLQFGYLPDA